VQSGRQPFLMPKFGLTMTEGVVSEWLRQPGAEFRRGDVLAVIETDKVANEVEAPADGHLAEVVVAAGDAAAVGDVIAYLHLGAAAGSASAAGRVLATPLARRLARQRGLDLARVTGSGPRGRIKSADLPPAGTQEKDGAALPIAAEPARAAHEPKPAAIREHATARRLTAAKRDVPHFYLATEIAIDRLLDLRIELRGVIDADVSLSHWLLLALARSLVDLPDSNAIWTDERGLVRLAGVDVGIAVATDHGLRAPVLRNLGTASLTQISRGASALVARARQGALVAADMGGGAASLSNAGMHDVTWMTSIINPGQSLILGVGSVREAFRPDERRQPVLRRELGVVMSCDHRVHDGVSGLRLLNRFKDYLERPLRLLQWMGDDAWISS